MAAMQFGHVDEYKEAEEDSESYIEHFEQWLLANDISSEKKVSVFLSVIGAETYGMLKNIVTPMKLSERTYKELKAALPAHYRPQPLVITKHFNFQKCSQKEGESVADYIVALRQLSLSCEFVNGLNAEAMQRKLLSQKDLMFNQACKTASSMELASRNTLEIAGKSKDLQSVHVVKEANLFHGKRESLRGEMILKKKNTRNRDKKKVINVTDVLGNMLLETADSRMRNVMCVTKSDTLLEPVKIKEQPDRHSMWKEK